MLMKRSFVFALTLFLSVVMSSVLYAAPITLETPTGTLHGTLELPENTSAPYPVALIIAGSGPTDRNGNNSLFSGPNDSLKMLAEALAARGIASLRYDKRGIGQSAKSIGNETDLRFETLIEDARLWGEQLKQDARFSKLVVIGHSEGALIGSISAGQVKADCFISIAGTSRPAGDLILEQIRTQLPDDLVKKSEAIVLALTKGQTIEDVPPQLGALFRASVQPYLISWFHYNPSDEIVSSSQRILIVQGTTDIQVGVDEAQALSQAEPRAELLIVSGMNHVLKDVPNERDKQLASYSDPSLPINQTLVDTVARFIST